MKIISLLFIFGFTILTISVYPQVKIYEDSRVKIFGDRPTDDLNKDLSMQVYGEYGQYLANGKIGFGEDYPNGPEVYIGEYGQNLDSDKLELYGKKGVYFTWGRGYGYSNILGSIQDIPYIIEDAFSFQTDVTANGVLLNSDKRYKKNIKPVTKSLSKLINVKGVKYNLKKPSSKTIEKTYPGIELSEKEQKDIAHFTNLEKKLKEIKKERLGFVAQELQIIFPELVVENEEGYFYVDYAGMIPLLIEAIKEQQATISRLQAFYQKQN